MSVMIFPCIEFGRINKRHIGTKGSAVVGPFLYSEDKNLF